SGVFIVRRSILYVPNFSLSPTPCLLPYPWMPYRADPFSHTHRRVLIKASVSIAVRVLAPYCSRSEHLEIFQPCNLLCHVPPRRVRPGAAARSPCCNPCALEANSLVAHTPTPCPNRNH